MGEKSISLENPSSPSRKGIAKYQKAILAIFIIFTLVFVGYYFFLLPYQDDSDLDDIFAYSSSITNPAQPKSTSPSSSLSNEDTDYEIFEEDDQISTVIDDTRDYLNYDYIETISTTTTESSYDYSENYSEGSGELDDENPFELEYDIPNCSKSFKIPEFNKIIFLVEKAKTPREAANFCTTNGLRFLKISNKEMKQKVFDGTKKIFGVGHGTALWIDGKWNEDEEIWDSWDDCSEVDVHPKERIIGDCSKIHSPIGKNFDISSDRCEIESYFYCEKMIEK